MDSSADRNKARAMASRCWRSACHTEGELDERITAFYESLCALFPPGHADSPWMAPHDAGIDHVIMYLSYSERSTPAIEAIEELAAKHGLVLWDPQSSDAYLPG
jgi:hypothetical protein